MSAKNGLTRLSKCVSIALGVIALCAILTSAGMAWGQAMSANHQAIDNAEDIHCMEIELSAINTKLDFIIEAIKDD